MASNGTFDPETRYVQLGERVENQARQIADIDVRMRQGFTEIGSQIRTLSDDVRGGAKTPWPIIIGFSSVVITILGGLGYLALQPIKDNIAQIREDAKIEQASNKGSFATIVERMVSAKEMEWRTARGAEDRARMENGLKEVRDAQVPRAELDRVFGSFVQQFADLQRQIEEMKQTQAGVYGPRDALFDLKKEIERLRDRSRRAPAVGG